jgi:hypothetical protein
MLLILYILSKVSCAITSNLDYLHAKFHIKHPRVSFCAFLKDISSCLACVFFSR